MSVSQSQKIESYFYKVSDELLGFIEADESLTVNMHGEQTQFIRFNQSKVRQSTEVQQYNISFDYIKNEKEISRSFNITFNEKEDLEQGLFHLKACRSLIGQLPASKPVVSPMPGESSSQIIPSEGADGFNLIDAILSPLQGLDMAGVFTSGPVYKGVNNSKGLKHWFSNNSFYLDYSLYSAKQKAVKGCYAGNEWDSSKYLNNLETSKDLLSKMSLDPIEVPKGKHRVYLAPAAVAEIVGTIFWGGFSMGAYMQGMSPFKKLKEGDEKLSSKFSLQENFELGLSPKFNGLGEVSAPVVNLISEGQLDNFLISSSTAKEYGLESNFANGDEAPRSAIVKPGQLANADILTELGTGLYISNLHYLNWSDRMSARITGMTRFACFWVENGQIQGPIKDLRFDESLYNCFGKNLVAVTKESEMSPNTSTYDIREIGGMSTPGMIVDNFNFTL